MQCDLNKRRAGVLLHITSLPGKGKQGELGAEAFRFVDFLHGAQVSVWQTLPLGMPHGDGSPYQCLSANAGNPAFIDLDSLQAKGWLDADDYQASAVDVEGLEAKRALLAKVFTQFLKAANNTDRQAFRFFCEQQYRWLEDFALFLALKIEFGQRSWREWPEPFKQRDYQSLREARRRLVDVIEFYKFEQFVFFQQWQALKHYAHQRGVLLLGDIPIFVAYDSVDVWAARKNFKLNDTGDMTVVAGVPPDYFSETGQRWGNPHYDWTYLQATGFKWWLERMRVQQQLFDVVRIDHFRGLEAAWEIPASEETAINGSWVEAPGKALLEAITTSSKQIKLIAEDLGIITEAVEELRDHFQLPGMKILQFAFDGSADNPYLPCRHIENCVVYTGTHDNNTTLGWFNALNDDEKHRVYETLGFPTLSMPLVLVREALASIANLVIIPMQDILELDAEHRMNTPGTMVGNWQWRFEWSQLSDEKIAHFRHWVELYARAI
ncbi:MAG: 4-alpha-glucanotransferase [Methylococcaceae bacterium]|nr:4-alpha-glucanotransferase [Methylococcaceae bacterium]